ncbi:replication initiation protein (plasmid) [Campylobacter fetus]|uniref:Replication initiation protein n=3 Tax=Campylobacter fetus TaxID=196 RepID=A0A974MS82_CAMFE|nr:replication initiation protein [Campylobacter fetus]AHE95250.1 plasmid replication protein [Campylobacter fetus subsp. venerealis cfvi03/293]KAA3682698.1 RepB family plasmid replication initiator protein [Campylobacter fetus subsp. venerealis]QMS59931.1 replication initiation protein [Campylobacter fetus]
MAKTKTQKAVVAQDNRFVFAKYDLNTNEMKFFMWIVAQLNSQKDQLFQVCEIPLSEVFNIWQWEGNTINYNYVRDVCNSMLGKTYIEDFKVIDEKTLKERKVFRGFSLFDKIEYKEGDSYISYKLNDSLMEYLVNLKQNFTQLKFKDIQQMKSAYSIRIYNMLMSEIGQNRTNFKINLEVLCNILEVPECNRPWFEFKRAILQRAIKDINTKSNLVILDVEAKKTGRKVTDIEISFEYKNNKKRIERQAKKRENFAKAIITIINDQYMGKSIKTKEYGILICESARYEKEKDQIIMACSNKDNFNKRVDFIMKDFNGLKMLEKCRNDALGEFYFNEFLKNDINGIFDEAAIKKLFDIK